MNLTISLANCVTFHVDTIPCFLDFLLFLNNKLSPHLFFTHFRPFFLLLFLFLLGSLLLLHATGSILARVYTHARFVQIVALDSRDCFWFSRNYILYFTLVFDG